VSFASFGSRRVLPAPRSGLLAYSVVASLVLLAGCSSSHTSQPSSTSRNTVTVPHTIGTQASTTTLASSAPTATTTQTPTTGSAPAALPTLGRLAGIFAKGKGFGQVRPSEIDNGGDPTGHVTQIVWNSWGGTQAIGSGTSDYVASGQTVAQGTEQPVTVVAFNPGTCGGKVMYRAVEWYFSQHGQAFRPNKYENICSGTYVGTP
jgi:hypothetical protein